MQGGGGTARGGGAKPSAPLLHSFEPVADASARVLVLGSMPGEESLRRRQYYAFPRNAFWPVMGALCGFDAALPYDERLAALRRAGVALWDVVGACRRAGSLDAAIEKAVPNDIPGLLRRYPRIGLVVCNGGAARALLGRFFPNLGPPVLRLPSTSPAAARLAFAGKLEAWRAALAPALGRAQR